MTRLLTPKIVGMLFLFLQEDCFVDTVLLRVLFLVHMNIRFWVRYSARRGAELNKMVHLYHTVCLHQIKI